MKLFTILIFFICSYSLEAQTPAADADYLCGKWTMSFGGESVWNPKYAAKDTSDWSYQFLENGIYYYKEVPGKYSSGTWELKGNLLTLRESEKQAFLEIIRLSPVWFEIPYQKGDTEEETIYIHMRKM